MRSVAIVILNWNGKRFLERFLPVLIERTPRENYNSSLTSFIAVADNGSTDGSVEWLKESYPDLELVEFEQNYGFTGGYNRALERISADYYILLNSDVEVGENWLDPLISFMESNPDTGIVMPKIKSYDRSDYFEYAGASGGFIDKYGYPFCRGRIMSKVEKDEGQYDEAIEIFWASGTCLMIRAGLFAQLGGFDENFFAHMEEIDLCWRAKLLGYEVWVVPESIVYHVGGGTLPNNSPQKLYLNYRNNLLMLYKNLPKKYKRRVIFIRKSLDNIASIAYLLSGKWSYFKSVHKAHSDYRSMKKETEISNTLDYPPTGIYGKCILFNRKPFKNGKLRKK